MNTNKSYKTELKELYENYSGKELEAVMPVTLRQVQKYLQAENAPEPGREVQRTIHDLFIRHKEGKPLSPDQEKDQLSLKTGYLEESVRNLTETERINASNIERLITLLEQQSAINLAQLTKNPLASAGPEVQLETPGFSFPSGKKKNFDKQQGRH